MKIKNIFKFNVYSVTPHNHELDKENIYIYLRFKRFGIILNLHET